MLSLRALVLATILCVACILPWMMTSAAPQVPPTPATADYASLFREQAAVFAEHIANPSTANQPFTTLQHDRNPGVANDSSGTRSIVALAIFVPLLFLLFVFFFVSLMCCIGTTKNSNSRSRSGSRRKRHGHRRERSREPRSHFAHTHTRTGVGGVGVGGMAPHSTIGTIVE